MSLIRSAAVVLLVVTLANLGFAQGSSSKPVKKSGSASSLQTTIEKLEKDGWEAFKNQDDKAYIALCTPDYTAVIADNKPPRDATAAAQVSHQIALHKYELSDFKVVSLGSDAALATYMAAVNATFGTGQPPQDIKLAVTDVWVKRGGHWLAIRYHESEIK
jgi:ketosteroid isomerase-like protein